MTSSALGSWSRSGLDETYLQGDDELPADGADGYLLVGDGWAGLADGTAYRPNTSAATIAGAAGAMVSTARDLAAWGDALYRGDVLEPGSLAEMVDFGDDRYGLGSRSYTLAGRSVWGHGGSLRGFVAQLWHLPEEDLTISVVINRGRVDPDVVATRLGKVILGHLFPSRPTFAAEAL